MPWLPLMPSSPRFPPKSSLLPILRLPSSFLFPLSFPCRGFAAATVYPAFGFYISGYSLPSQWNHPLPVNFIGLLPLCLFPLLRLRQIKPHPVFYHGADFLYGFVAGKVSFRFLLYYLQNLPCPIGRRLRIIQALPKPVRHPL